MTVLNTATFPALQPPTYIDYTSRDFLGLVTSMVTYAQHAFPDWNVNASEGDFGVVMLELFAYMGDIMSYYMDRISQEAYLPTATQRLSILNIAQLLGYIPGNGAPASGTVTFATDDPGVPVTIPAGTQVQAQFSTTADEPPIFETVADVLVPANGGTKTAEVVQGITYTLTLIGTSDGTPNQDMTIPQPHVIDGSVKIYVQSGDGLDLWKFVQFLVDEDSDDFSYAQHTDDGYVTHVIFGDNLNGAIPSTGMNIYATYRIGVGAAGNLPAGSVSELVDGIEGVSINILGDGVTPDSSAMTGGADPEDIETIRRNAPQAFRAQFRAVSPQDFSDLALNVSGVQMAHAVSTHSNSVTLYALGPNYQTPGPALRDAILTYFDDKMLAGVTLSVAAPDIIPVDIGSNANPTLIYVKDTYQQYPVFTKVVAALQALLSPPNVNFGEFLTEADIYTAIMGVDGVLFAVLSFFTRHDVAKTDTTPIQFRESEVPQAGSFYLVPAGGLAV